MTTVFCANFKLDIDGLPNASARVAKIEALVFKQVTLESQGGGSHNHEIPNLFITVPTSHAEEFYQWHEDFVINGNNGQEQEKNGSLEFLLPDMKKSLLTLKFDQLGIFKLTTGKVEAAGENILPIKAEMYCEKMRLLRNVN